MSEPQEDSSKDTNLLEFALKQKGILKIINKGNRFEETPLCLTYDNTSCIRYVLIDLLKEKGGIGLEREDGLAYGAGCRL